MFRGPISWSYSALKLYESCPGKYAYAKIAKLPTPDAYPLMRGLEIHSKAENYLLGNIRGIPRELKKFDSEFKAIKKLKAAPELDIAVREDWSITSWTATDTWCRGKIDAALPMDNGEADIIDFKTGRIYPDHRDQAEIYSCLMLSYYEHKKKKVEIVNVEFWYLDKGITNGFSYEKKDILELKKKWEKKAEPMFLDKEFGFTPSDDACRWCPFRSDKKLRDGTPGPCNEFLK